ncbi:TVP38/TMEM64 family protein [Actinocorallia libanotica]|uniref:TVP38/TMEM64 family membrane protein n=1 Tax=Actinocorallia libanotica TaxID=46162 RepID=A0ABN1Q913_9ACTN
MRFTLLVAGAAVAAAAAAYLVPDRDGLAAAVESAGGLNPLLAVLGAWVLVLAMVPRTALAFVGGLLFGLGPGAGYVLAGALLGASTAFLIGRFLGREFIDGVLSREHPGRCGALAARTARLDRWLGRNGIIGVVMVRFLPIAPYGLVSYAFGTSATRYRDFLLGSAVGVLPSTLGYAALGAAVFGPSAATMGVAVVGGLGLLSLVVTIGLHRVRKNEPHPSPGPSRPDNLNMVRR